MGARVYHGIASLRWLLIGQDCPIAGRTACPTNCSHHAVAVGQGGGVLARDRLGEEVGVGVAERGLETVAQALYENSEEGLGTRVVGKAGG